ncbi:Carboxylesterase type B [Clostridium sp. DL-VIII]|uniref:carboxylesterase/lipase family protein n=1 Tax=Clostridium sp. DL-VIII TaxID=641107 RepID=UPI00023B0026|nr:carboxylesterase family protein [Clostridium sp. DL-VIII]EHI99142.1 Carboxylesterase type B [Clostridium sp. DL-VIII]
MIKNKQIILRALVGVMTFSLVTAFRITDNNSVAKASTKSATEQSGTISAGPGIAVVDTEAGKVQGYIRNGIYTYHGVPYAEAKERFVPAQKAQHWDGVKLAFNYGPISPQEQTSGAFAFFESNWENSSRQFTMDNNSQNLNIWTPGINNNAKRPVMVWLHGGGFQSGSSAAIAPYDGENLSKKGDVVVVSVNHRLNALGYLDLSQYGEKYKYSENVGITDIVASLQWIRDNIEQFGGDPNNVTVFGESGGGAKVLALMTTPYAKGLFQKGIVESGATEPMGVNFTSKEASKRVTELTLQNLGITGDQIEKLQTVPYEQLSQASDKALKQTADELHIPVALGGGYSLSWEPVVDGDYMPTSPVTDKGFAEAGKDVPLLIGSNLTEWTAMSQVFNMDKAQSDNPNTWTEEEVDKHLKDTYGDKADEVVQAFLQAYPDKKKADAVYIDSMIRLPLLKIMSRKADQQGAPVYSYLFSWESPVMNGVFTAYHTSEIPFVFDNIDKADTTIGGGQEAKILEDRMSQAWINFAKTGNPSIDNLPKWEAYDRKAGATMIFDNKVKLVYNHDKKLLSLLAPNYKY